MPFHARDDLLDIREVGGIEPDVYGLPIPRGAVPRRGLGRFRWLVFRSLAHCLAPHEARNDATGRVQFTSIHAAARTLLAHSGARSWGAGAGVDRAPSSGSAR